MKVSLIFQLIGGLFRHLAPAPAVPFAASAAIPSTEPSWLQVARRELGQQEVAGAVSNPRIVEYHRATALGATSDEVAWCSAFVNWCLQQVGIHVGHSAMARSWLAWGVKLAEPLPGCVVVFWRGSRDADTGHVALFLRRVGDLVEVLGGNQGDAVSVARYPADRVLGYRWPDEAKLPVQLAPVPVPAVNDDAAVDVVARTLWGEARGEGRRGIEAVAAVIVNRVRIGGWWGKTAIFVCRKPFQFSCWNDADPNLPKLQAVRPGERDFDACIAVARAALAGTLPDPTGGATHYYDRRMHVAPAWSVGAELTATIGNHRFFKGVK